jgi:hypothetical protein
MTQFLQTVKYTQKISPSTLFTSNQKTWKKQNVTEPTKYNENYDYSSKCNQPHGFIKKHCRHGLPQNTVFNIYGIHKENRTYKDIKIWFFHITDIVKRSGNKCKDVTFLNRTN